LDGVGGCMLLACFADPFRERGHPACNHWCSCLIAADTI
jgi:hypothetical protein